MKSVLKSSWMNLESRSTSLNVKVCQTWTEVTAFYTTPGFCRERMHLFFAEDLDRGEARPEDDEDLEIVRWARNEISAKVAEIQDAKTLVGLLLYLQRGEAGDAHKVG